VSSAEGGWRLTGTAVLAHAGKACRLDYLIVCDPTWRTVSTLVTGWVGDRTVDLRIGVDPAGRWRLDGAECPGVDGCLDVDLAFSPSTNLLPIRRLALAVGQQGAVAAAWLRFPEFRLERLDQVYRRLDAETYRYESAGGSFVRELTVNAAGLVTRYPGLWEAEA
jgi:hypothetical protein